MSGAERRPELERLARQAAGGDELAFARLVHAVRPRLYRWALVQVGDADDAEDITQAVSLRLHRGLAGFRHGSALGTWLYTLVRSAAADWRRGVKRRSVRQRSYATSHATFSVAPDRVDADRLLALVRDQLGALPARQREVFDLAELQGVAPGEVARLLGLGESTVRVHLLRARRAIRARVLARHGALSEVGS